MKYLSHPGVKLHPITGPMPSHFGAWIDTTRGPRLAPLFNGKVNGSPVFCHTRRIEKKHIHVFSQSSNYEAHPVLLCVGPRSFTLPTTRQLTELCILAWHLGLSVALGLKLGTCV
jgi:hypothetical protein